MKRLLTSIISLFLGLLLLPSSQAASCQVATIQASAHWLTAEHLIIADPQLPAATSLLMVAENANGSKSTVATLKTSSIPKDLQQRFPHLANYPHFLVAAQTSDLKSLLRHKLTINDNNCARYQIQLGAIIDWLYTRADDDADNIENYGAVYSADEIQLTLWAPLAQRVTIKLYNQDKTPVNNGEQAMRLNDITGAWQISLPKHFDKLYYRFEIEQYYPQIDQFSIVEVTDPYSVSLSTNSQFSQLIDLNSDEVKPEHWDSHNVPVLARPEQHIIYETHVGDFSGTDQSLSNKVYQGRYLAFTEQNSASIKHLKQLQQAGLNTIHLLPVFDIGTINEEVNQQVRLSDSVAKLCQKTTLAKCTIWQPQQTVLQLLRSFTPASADAQQVIEAMREFDDYNWGYDPFHYNVPEGSYATNPEGSQRIIEFRQMVMALHQIGLRVVMDVVYNHTHSAGLTTTAVLDKIVPNYYQRLDPITGSIHQSTCCDNTATEQVMMAKLMQDSLVLWAKHYKIDGFRFDLMGHQPKQAMLAAREAVQKIDSDNYFYGEGWNFGEVANNARFIQASQLELTNTSIGTFTDRLRDAIRGGSSFASGEQYRQAQGLATGLAYFANELNQNRDNHALFATLKQHTLIGLSGNLTEYPLPLENGKIMLGKDLRYGDQPLAYAGDPADTINYVSKHDNQTLWDNLQYRVPTSMSTDDRVALQILSLSFPMLAQGIPFIHMGSELLRSKSFLRDSYDYGHWFNAVDFSYQTNNYNVGLPPAVKDQANWPIIARLLQENSGRDIPTKKHILTAKQAFKELLAIRSSTNLFSLADAPAIIEQVKFESATEAGVLIMIIKAQGQNESQWQQIKVIFNLTAKPQSVTFDSPFQIHPAQQVTNKVQSLSNSQVTVDKLSFTVLVQ